MDRFFTIIEEVTGRRYHAEMQSHRHCDVRRVAVVVRVVNGRADSRVKVSDLTGKLEQTHMALNVQTKATDDFVGHHA